MSMPERASTVSPVAVFGEEEIVAGFHAIGCAVYAAATGEEFRAALTQALAQGAAICLVQDVLYRQAESAIQAYKGAPLPVFIPFAKSGTTDILGKILKDIRLKATGAL